MAFCTVANFRSLTNLTTSDLSDAEVTALIPFATSKLNSDINTKVIRERVFSIDNTRTNYINGSNTTFYVRNWEGKYIGDMDNDGDVDSSDITVYVVNSDGTESTATVSSVTSSTGKFVLSSAPSTTTASEMYVTYEWCYDDPSTPSARITLACVFLVAAFGYAKRDWGMAPEQAWGNERFRRDMQASNRWYKMYEEQISKINGQMGGYSEAEIF